MGWKSLSPLTSSPVVCRCLAPRLLHKSLGPRAAVAPSQPGPAVSLTLGSGSLGLNPGGGWHLDCGTLAGHITSVSVLLYKMGKVMGRSWNLAGAEDGQFQLSLVPGDEEKPWKALATHPSHRGHPFCGASCSVHQPPGVLGCGAGAGGGGRRTISGLSLGSFRAEPDTRIRGQVAGDLIPGDTVAGVEGWRREQIREEGS